ncbi:MAG TPA: YggS family pyridoxal phosphate-dependent enzyme [Candidatus Omnitrophota bacterium]|nr:YggS family pyridoxal phosphate-dependent enzyme [Candidatus Omnitrophota bacterium]HRY85881.1 YggS family pyridoxal phosphate-dependent enzyme [Candidatus Omnitrophota bacterium]
MTVIPRLRDLKDSIRRASVENGRDPGKIRLVLVTKTTPPEKIEEAYETGERDFGENRVQEWLEKKERLPRDIRWHLIGHLQTNKVKQVVGEIFLIHSLDRLELADAIERTAKSKGINEVPCLVQVNMSGEESKFGLAPEAVEGFIEQMSLRPSIKLLGLMTIGPLTEDQGRIRECFRKSRELLERLKQEFPQYGWDILSMGMSGDYRIAIEEGANMLRIGSLVFPRGGKNEPA